MSLSRDNVSIKTQKCAHFQLFRHAISAPSVKRPQTEKMRSTKACDARALIKSCAKGASRLRFKTQQFKTQTKTQSLKTETKTLTFEENNE